MLGEWAVVWVGKWKWVNTRTDLVSSSCCSLFFLCSVFVLVFPFSAPFVAQQFIHHGQFRHGTETIAVVHLDEPVLLPLHAFLPQHVPPSI